MQAQSRLITKRFNGHSDRSQSRRCRPLGLPEVGGPGSDADVYLMSWNLVYIEKSACLQDTTSVSPSPSFSCRCDVVQGSRRSPGMACDTTRAMPSRTAPLGVPSARGLATRVVSLSWAGSAHGQGLGTPGEGLRRLQPGEGTAVEGGGPSPAPTGLQAQRTGGGNPLLCCAVPCCAVLWEQRLREAPGLRVSRLREAPLHRGPSVHEPVGVTDGVLG